MSEHKPGPVSGCVGERYVWTIRRARKAHHCYECPPHSRTIRPGDLYCEADVDPYEAGGFGHERLCLPHLDRFEASLLEDVGD